MLNGTTAWAQLAASTPIQYAIPYIDPSSLQPTLDTSNFIYRSAFGSNASGAFSVGNTGDTSGTDSVNTGGQQDSYMPVVLQNIANIGQVPGHTTSVSRGTRLQPLVSLAGDFAGLFSSYAYTGVALAESYKEITGIRNYVRGASATDPGGGMRLGTKLNAGIFTEWMELNELGQLFPVVAGAPTLGKSAFGYKGLYLDYTISGVSGAQVINKPAGRFNIAIGASTVTITNSLVTANSIVIAQLAFVDATLTFVKATVSAAGSFTVTGNANATAVTACNFIVINTD